MVTYRNYAGNNTSDWQIWGIGTSLEGCNLKKFICFFFFFSFFFLSSPPLSLRLSRIICRTSAIPSSIARHLRFPDRGGSLHHALTHTSYNPNCVCNTNCNSPIFTQVFYLFYSKWGSPMQPSLSSSSSPVSQQPHWEHHSLSTTSPPMERPRSVRATSRRSTWPSCELEGLKIWGRYPGVEEIWSRVVCSGDFLISRADHPADFHCWLDPPAGPGYYRPHTYTEDTTYTKDTGSS